MNGGKLQYNPELLVEENAELVKAVLRVLPDVEDQDFHWELTNTEKGQQVLDILIGLGIVHPGSDVTARRIAFILRDKEHYIRRGFEEREITGEQLELQLQLEA